MGFERVSFVSVFQEIPSVTFGDSSLREGAKGRAGSSRPTQNVVLHVPGRAAAGRPYENVAEHVGRGGLWPPADPRRDAHHKGGRKIEMPPFPVPPA